jgi:hypothetical protein
MKTHRRILFLLFCLAVLPSTYRAQAQVSQQYWEENVAILDMRTRSVSATAYVREIVLLDFKGQELLPLDFGFGPDLFADLGKDFDRTTGDGVYTSERCYFHNAAVPFVALGQEDSALGPILVDPAFQYWDELNSKLETQKGKPGASQQPAITTCNLKKCACPSACICVACEWGPSAWCLDWCNCQTLVSLHW